MAMGVFVGTYERWNHRGGTLRTLGIPPDYTRNLGFGFGIGFFWHNFMMIGGICIIYLSNDDEKRFLFLSGCHNIL